MGDFCRNQNQSYESQERKYCSNGNNVDSVNLFHTMEQQRHETPTQMGTDRADEAGFTVALTGLH